MLPVKPVLKTLSADRVTVNCQLCLPIAETHHDGSLIINASAIYDLRHELGRIRDSFTDKALMKKIDLSLFIAKDIPVAFLDMNSLRIHVFNNILSNVIHHSPVGSTIFMSVTLSDNYTMAINISDSDTGISAPRKESIFRKYQKLGKYNTRYWAGLENAMLCIQAHEGTISIIHAPMLSGVTFKIEIPLYSQCIC